MWQRGIYSFGINIFIAVILCCALSSCITTNLDIEEDNNNYDDIYEMSNGEFIVVQDNKIYVTSSLLRKEKHEIKGIMPHVRNLNPQIIDNYIFISQDISSQTEPKTIVSKIEIDTFELVDEREFAFEFDCMTSNGKELVFAGCVSRESQEVCCLINTDLEARYIESNLQTLYFPPARVIEIDKIYHMCFSGNKGVMITSSEINNFDYCLLCTVVIEDNVLSICKNFYIGEPNSQILYTDYDKVLNFVYNSDGTDPMVLTMNAQMKYVEVNSDSLFEIKVIPQKTTNLNIEDYRFGCEKEKIIRIVGKGVGEYLYKEDGFGKFIQIDKWFYYVYIGGKTIKINKINQDNLEVKNNTRIAHFELEREIDIESIRRQIIKTEDGSIYFHLSDKEGYIVAGFIDISGIWI